MLVPSPYKSGGVAGVSPGAGEVGCRVRPSAGMWHSVTLPLQRGQAAAGFEGRRSEHPPASACAPNGAAKGFLAERTVTQLSARLHGELRGAGLLFSVEEIRFLSKRPCESR